jgi:hypothetical protein
MLEPPKIQLLDFLYGEWGEPWSNIKAISLGRQSNWA